MSRQIPGIRPAKHIAETAAVVLLTALFTGCSAVKAVIPDKDTALEEPAQEAVAETAPEDIVPEVQEPDAVLAETYEMAVDLDTEHDAMEQVTIITVKNNTEESVDSVCLRFNPAGLFDFIKKTYPGKQALNEGKYGEVTSVLSEASQEELPLTYSLNNTAIQVDLSNHVIPAGETAKLRVVSHTDILEAEVKFSLVKKGPGKFYKLVFCYPYLEYNRGGTWFVDPPEYRHVGENRNPDLSDYRVNVHVPEEFRVASAGTQVHSENGTVTIVADQLRDFAMFVSDYMDVDTFDAEGTLVHSYYLNDGAVGDYRELSRQFITDAVHGYNELLGPCGRNEIAVVEGFNGMEYSGIVEIVGTAFYRNWPAGYLESFKNITHEIGHLWVFDTVGNYEYAEGWIDEGFVSYLTKDEILSRYCHSYDLLREKYPKAKSAKQYATDRKREVSLLASDLKGRKTYSLFGAYSKVEKTSFLGGGGAGPGSKEYYYSRVAFSRLKNLMGDAEFYAFLRDFYATYRWKIVDTDDVLELIRKHSDDEHISQDIHFWFPEYPDAGMPEEEPENSLRGRLKPADAHTEEGL